MTLRIPLFSDVHILRRLHPYLCRLLILLLIRLLTVRWATFQFQIILPRKVIALTGHLKSTSPFHRSQSHTAIIFCRLFVGQSAAELTVEKDFSFRDHNFLLRLRARVPVHRA